MTTEFDLERNVARASMLKTEQTLDAVNYVATCVRSEGVKPRVHPNGFIQLDLVPNSLGKRAAMFRLHVWPDGSCGDIPRQSLPTVIHDHTFAIDSRVLKGSIINWIWWLRTNGGPTHEIWTAVYDNETRESVLTPTGRIYRAEKTSGSVINKGSLYRVPCSIFHATSWRGLTATIMQKVVGSELDRDPRVLVPLGGKPDNSFQRYAVSEEVLWRYIEKALSHV